MKGIRGERLAEEIRNSLSEILLSRAEDPRLRSVLVTRVEISPDLASARVHVSALGDEDAQLMALKAATRAASFLRSELARRVRLRRVPELTFRLDPGIRHSIRMQELLKELGLGEGVPGEEAPLGEKPDASSDDEEE